MIRRSFLPEKKGRLKRKNNQRDSSVDKAEDHNNYMYFMLIKAEFHFVSLDWIASPPCYTLFRFRLFLDTFIYCFVSGCFIPCGYEAVSLYNVLGIAEKAWFFWQGF